MEIFLHSAGRQMPKVVEVAPESTVAELIASFGSEGDGAWIEGVDQELEGAATLSGVGVREHDHAHLHHCRHVEVTVRYVDQDKVKRYAPATRVGVVLAWALGPEGFNIPETERPAFGFLGCGDGKAVSDDTHVGSLTNPGRSCEACLSLVKKHNPQG